MDNKNKYLLGKITMNTLRICILASIAIFLIHPLVFGSKNKTYTHVPQKPLTLGQKEHLIILWDIHEVILEKDIYKIFSAFWHDGLQYNVFKNLSFGLISDLSSLLYQKIFYDNTGEEFVVAAQQRNNLALIALIKNIANAQKPIQGTVDIIKALKQCNFTHHIGSNIGKSVFQELIIKPDLVHIFNNFELEHSQVVTYTKGHDIIKKPDPRYFEIYLDKNNLTPEQVLFIDDRIENIKTAKQLGMHTIHFQNPEQLKADLQMLLDIDLSCQVNAIAK